MNQETGIGRIGRPKDLLTLLREAGQECTIMHALHEVSSMVEAFTLAGTRNVDVFIVGNELYMKVDDIMN